MDNTKNKLYYSIGEVSEMLDVRSSLIRFWEKEFKMLNPKKNKKGNRLFTNKDIELLRKIYHLVKENGYTLEGAKQQLKVREESTNDFLLSKLQLISKELKLIRDNL
jgi:DNA-binding transcriptional MerR regulator